MPDPIYIVAARRTPQGRFLGGLATHSAIDLAVAAAEAVLEAAAPEQVDELILGNVLSAGLGLNPARQVTRRLGLPEDRPAFLVNQACASGLLAVVLARQAILAGDAEVVLCGGAESMSAAPHLVRGARKGIKLGDGKLEDAILVDGLVDTLNGEHMALTAERLGREYDLDRVAQDHWACLSHERAVAAQREGAFDAELVAVGETVADEHPRANTSVEALAELAPAFDPEGTVTAGNASGINDGAAMLLVASAAACERHGYEPLAQITGEARVGCDPRRMGLGPVAATRRLLAKTGGTPDDFDCIEINEAFAAQTLACLDGLELADGERVNPHGGAIALGHPVGASGARLAVHLAHLVGRGEAGRALATLCVGGGMGIAVSFASVC